MNIHEYQAKDLLKEFGAPVPKGVAVHNIDEIKQRKFRSLWFRHLSCFIFKCSASNLLNI